MKRNELMVGDWVCYNSANGYYTRVNQIRHTEDEKDWYIEGIRDNSDNIATGKLDLFHVDIIKPIFLTPEILEKNGFVYDSEDKLFEDIYPRISMLYAQYRLVENGCINYGEMSEIKYVHELQHALRLCGITREIII